MRQTQLVLNKENWTSVFLYRLVGGWLAKPGKLQRCPGSIRHNVMQNFISRVQLKLILCLLVLQCYNSPAKD